MRSGRLSVSSGRLSGLAGKSGLGRLVRWVGISGGGVVQVGQGKGLVGWSDKFGLVWPGNGEQ